MLTVILNGGGWIELVMWITSSSGLSEIVMAQTSMAVVVTANILATSHMRMQIVDPTYPAESEKQSKHCVYNIVGKR